MSQAATATSTAANRILQQDIVVGHRHRRRRARAGGRLGEVEVGAVAEPGLDLVRLAVAIAAAAAARRDPERQGDAVHLDIIEPPPRPRHPRRRRRQPDARHPAMGLVMDIVGDMAERVGGAERLVAGDGVRAADREDRAGDDVGERRAGLGLGPSR